MSEVSIKRKTIVAHVMPWSGLGGTEIATLRMIEATRENFHHIAFFKKDATLLQEALTSVGVEKHTYDPPEPSFRHGVKYYRDSAALARQLRSVNADIVHFPEIKGAYQNSLAAFLARTRIICHVRNTYPQLSFREKLTLKLIDQFVFVSEQARRAFAVKVAPAHARVIYDAIEIPTIDVSAVSAEVRAELGISPSAIVIGMVARVNPQKDYFTLAAAAAIVLKRHPGTCFVIVGDNSSVEINREHYEQVVRALNELGIRDSFLFTGHRSDVNRLMTAMDISVLCTHREGFGLVIAESMALGKPVVATAVGGVLEVVQDGVTGYLHAHENSTELAASLNALLDDRDTMRQFGSAGRRSVQEKFSKETFVREISRLYTDAVNGPSRP